MNDNTAQATQNQSTSYVDDYQPPVSQGGASVLKQETEASKEVASDVKSEPVADIPVNDPVSFDDLIEASVSAPQVKTIDPVESMPAEDEASDSVISKPTTEPILNPDASVQTIPEPINKPTTSETLEDQNIFAMLGVEDGTEELKENFLNELQQVIWDDFLENDVNLLITSDEKVKFDEIMAKKDKADAGKPSKEADDKIQDALVAYLETLIPDLEDIMLEKALDLKSDLFAERIIGMKEYHANNPENLATVNSAEKMMHEDKWYSSAQLLNKITTE